VDPGSRIQRIETFAVRFPLAAPLQIGPMRIVHRDYAVLRVTTGGGVRGHAYCLSRSAPVDLMITDVLAPIALGSPAADIDGLRRRWADATITLGHDGILARAVSMMDVALWDIRAQSASVPLWRLLGEARTEAEVLLVEGYPRVGEDAAAFAARLRARADQGAMWHKVASLPDGDELTRRLQLSRAALGPDARLIVDIAWTWNDTAAAIALAGRWADLGLAWIEDPLPVADLEGFASLHAGIRTPLGAGDESSRIDELGALVDSGSIDVARFDMMTMGGVTGFQQLAERLDPSTPISSHIYPEINRHLAFAFEQSGAVEWYGDSAEFDMSARFAHLTDGELTVARCTAPEAPGVGLDFDWAAIEAAAYRATDREATS